MIDDSRDLASLRPQVAALESQIVLGERREAELRSELGKFVHDLRTPVNTIATAGYLIQRATEDGARKKAADVIERQVQILARLASDLAALARVTAADSSAPN
jgi:signal transduction histidine kinase